MTTAYAQSKSVTVNTRVGLSPSSYIYAVDRKSSSASAAAGSSGGTSIAGWQLRQINYPLINTITGAGIQTGDFGIYLPAGTYYIEASAPAYKSGRTVLGIYQDNVEIAVGPTEHTSSGDASQVRCCASAVVELTARADIELYQYIEVAKSGDGLGVNMSYIDYAIYSEIKAWRLD